MKQVLSNYFLYLRVAIGSMLVAFYSLLCVAAPRTAILWTSAVLSAAIGLYLLVLFRGRKRVEQLVIGLPKHWEELSIEVLDDGNGPKINLPESANKGLKRTPGGAA